MKGGQDTIIQQSDKSETFQLQVTGFICETQLHLVERHCKLKKGFKDIFIQQCKHTVVQVNHVYGHCTDLNRYGFHTEHTTFSSYLSSEL